MADQKITELTEDTTPISTDIVATVDDPGGSPVTKKVTVGNLSKGMTVASANIAEAFFKGRKQANTTNSDVSGFKIMHGWGFIVGDASAQLQKTVTFPTAFSSPPVVVVGGLSAAPTASGTPTDTDDFVTNWTNPGGYGAEDVTSSAFEMNMAAFTGTFSASLNMDTLISIPLPCNINCSEDCIQKPFLGLMVNNDGISLQLSLQLPHPVPGRG